jgi:hypothetical protein
MWDFFNSSFGLLLTGFVCTGVVGTFLNSRFQMKAWERQKKHDLLLRTLEDGKQLFDEISILLNRRAFGLLKVLWAIEENERSAAISAKWDAYYANVRTWNEELQSMRFKTEALAGEAIANQLLDYQDTASSLTPQSIHYRMRRAHLAIRDLRDVRDDDQRATLYKEAQSQMDELQKQIEDFLKTIAKALLYSGRTLAQQVSNKSGMGASK